MVCLCVCNVKYVCMYIHMYMYMHTYTHPCSNMRFSVDRLLFVINAIKEEIMMRVEDSSPGPTNMTDTLERLIQETLGENQRVEQENLLTFSGQKTF